MVENMDKIGLFCARLSCAIFPSKFRSLKYFAIFWKIYRKIVAKTPVALYNMNKYFLGVKICN